MKFRLNRDRYSKPLKPLGPAWDFIASVVLLLAAAWPLYLFVAGIITGVTIKFSKNPGIATMHGRPDRFWESEALLLGLGLVIAGIGVGLLMDGLRQLRR